ncbi:hypothetical protein MMC17_005594 [Xylographa soralifera]|nr:hypothetical protein [Xylographa soralifera]
MRTTGYKDSAGGSELDFVGFDAEVVDDSKLRFWFINNRPRLDESGQYLDAYRWYINATIEVFETKRGSDDLVHVKTYAHEMLVTPNKPAVVGNGGENTADLLIGGLRRELEVLLGGGNVVYCSPSGCHVAASTGFSFPNGMVKGMDGLYYVPQIMKSRIRVMELQQDLTLNQIDTIYIGMPVDNLSVDKNGDIWAAGIPKAFVFTATFEDPFERKSPSTIWRIRKLKKRKGYEVRKILEDKEANVMSGATVAIHDVKTGKLFISGAVVPYITMCEPT